MDVKVETKRGGKKKNPNDAREERREELKKRLLEKLGGVTGEAGQSKSNRWKNW